MVDRSGSKLVKTARQMLRTDFGGKKRESAVLRSFRRTILNPLTPKQRENLAEDALNLLESQRNGCQTRQAGFLEELLIRQDDLQKRILAMKSMLKGVRVETRGFRDITDELNKLLDDITHQLT